MCRRRSISSARRACRARRYSGPSLGMWALFFAASCAAGIRMVLSAIRFSLGTRHANAHFSNAEVRRSRILRQNHLGRALAALFHPKVRWVPLNPLAVAVGLPATSRLLLYKCLLLSALAI